jgi:catechol 2,3-dioxygenase-like lactoylglutathione lyase family enzyme
VVFDHVEIRVRDRDASHRFYTVALGEPTHDGDVTEWRDFGLLEEDFVSRNLHVAFGVPSREHVDAWWQRLVDAGYESDGKPGVRPEYSESYYGAFVLDPDGNSAESVHHAHSSSGIDHLWLGTRDVAAARAFYTAVAPVLGLRLVNDEPGRVRFRGDGASFTFVDDGRPVTERMHIAFSAPDEATVDAFHAAAIESGFRDNGQPGERPHYHPGYYGAFVLDPDGHNVEAVFHGRPG